MVDMTGRHQSGVTGPYWIRRRWVDSQLLGWVNLDQFEIGMVRIEHVVVLGRKNHTGDAQYGRPPRDEPAISKGLCHRPRRAVVPTLGQILGHDLGDERLVESDPDQRIVDQRRLASESRQYFEGGEGPRLGHVHSPATRAVPASAMDPSTFPVKRLIEIAILDDSPRSDH
jgi:hypothetical protein